MLFISKRLTNSKKKLKHSDLKNAESLIDSSTTVFWFRRDLRLQDNAGLYHALKENKKVLPIFIFDTNILNNLEDKADKRVEFIHQSLELIKKQLEELSSSLLVLYGNPVTIYQKLNPKAVYTNHDYEPYARKRDEEVSKILVGKGSELKTFKPSATLRVFGRGSRGRTCTGTSRSPKPWMSRTRRSIAGSTMVS